ncbi:sensor histidine kinase [Actinomadura welshii]
MAERTVITVPDGSAVLGDPVRLRQCLLLVFGNAEKYAPDGKIDITVRRHGSSAVLSIADEGPGVPADECERIREPYYRSEATQDQPGSGMGLHIADTVMAAMNGRLELAAAPSGGLDVRFHLPLAEPPDGERR